MPESETDLVGGFHTEYGAFKFGIFFVAEYSHMVIGSSLFILMFLGGWHVLPWLPTVGEGWVASLVGVASFFLKLCFFLFFFVWVRWTHPALPVRPGDAHRLARAPARSPSLNLLAYFAWYAFRG
jgi:NADH-quinone oxidoreductase subunit H